VKPSAAAITPELAEAAALERVTALAREVRFEDIGGYEALKRALREEVVEMAQLAWAAPPARRAAIWESCPRGLLLHGPPGVGKTLFAQALAGALGGATTRIAGPEVMSMWQGESERRIREIFARARRARSVVVIVIDEIDSFARARGGHPGSEHRQSVVNQLLSEMDGLHSDRSAPPVFVVATTNFMESLDSALLRPGRFALQLRVPYPDADARRAIARLYDARYDLSLGEALIERLVARTGGPVGPDGQGRFSGDHVEAICRALRRRRLRAPGWRVDAEALDALIGQRAAPLGPEEEAVVAAHEAGHALAARLHPHGARVRRISIEPTAGRLGAVDFAEAAPRVLDERRLRARLVCLMGGRAAERLVFGGLSAGAQDDLAQATALAERMVAEWGMDEALGPRRVGEGASAALRAQVDERVSALLRAADAEALELLRENRAALDDLRARLVTEREVTLEDHGATR